MNLVFSYLNQLFNHDDRADGRGLLDHTIAVHIAPRHKSINSKYKAWNTIARGNSGGRTCILYVFKNRIDLRKNWTTSPNAII